MAIHNEFLDPLSKSILKLLKSTQSRIQIAIISQICLCIKAENTTFGGS